MWKAAVALGLVFVQVAVWAIPTRLFSLLHLVLDLSGMNKWDLLNDGSAHAKWLDQCDDEIKEA